MAVTHERLRELFIAACDLSAREQAALLDCECANDSTLRRELEALLHKDSTDRGILSEEHLTAGVQYHTETPVDRDLPESIERYQVLKLLGQGGMGAVYLARQEDPQRDVAVKVIRPGMLSPEIASRFKRETAVLGLLQHPGIAQILEAGTATVRGPAGPVANQPFFAMEYVDGLPINEYAPRNGLTTRDKLRLISDVCHAVYSAHQRGVIHRDLKPANILVTQAGQVKLLDFGVARLVSDESRASTLSTELGQLVGTLAYMSPEQLTGDPDSVDTRSDVYSIGVVLYEILSGKLPYPAQSRSIPQAIRRFAEKRPDKLSRWDPQFRGDVETIVEKALEQDKERRYQSALELAADIHRYLENLPIEARPASTWYQTRKFAARHRGLVGGMVTVFIVLVGGIAATAWQADRAASERDLAARERDRANSERERASQQTLRQRETAALLSEMIKSVTPEFARGNEPTIREMLGKTSEELRGDHSIHPVVAGDTHRIVADAYLALGDYDIAEQHARRAIELLSAELGSNAADTLWAQVSFANILSRQDRDEEAVAVAREGLASARKHLDRTHDVLISFVNVYGFVLLNSPDPDYEAAAELHRESYELWKEKHGSRHRRAQLAATNLGTALLELGRLEEAERWLRQVYSVRLEKLAAGDPMLLSATWNLAYLLAEKGDLEAAAELTQTLVSDAERVLGSDHPTTIRYRLQIARLEFRLGHANSAAAYARDALEAAVSRLGESHETTILARGLLVNMLIAAGATGEAEELALQQHGLCHTEFGARHPYTVRAVTLLFDLAEARQDVESMRRWATDLRGTEWEEPARQMIEQMQARIKTEALPE